MAAWRGKTSEHGSENKGQVYVKGECAYNRMKGKKKMDKESGERKRK